MVSAFDVPANDLIRVAAEQLKKTSEIKAPAWAAYAKTGMHKEHPPAQTDWWFSRSAAVLLTVRKKGPIGVQKLRTKYGGRKNRGHKPERFYKGSGNILRKVFQQLEAAKLVQQVKVGIHKGRIVTPQGVSFLDKCAVSIYKKAEKKTAAPSPASPVPSPAKEQSS
ncbi:30S ribosomal protein S19e [Candidatus Woesearchaeota archaeon]|nr:30S ribosomal protein S19e [Candidatus Woesearchaeota archaeon]